MKAHVVGPHGPEISDRPKPSPGPDDVVVRVRACALNRADLAMARGVRHGPAGGTGAVMGLEWAGEVAEVGANVDDLKPGDRVMGSGAEAFAEYALSDRGRVLVIPRAETTFEQAVCLPVSRFQLLRWFQVGYRFALFFQELRQSFQD